MMTNTTDRPVAERLVIRYYSFYLLHGECTTEKSRMLVLGKMEGLAEAASILGITMAPAGFVTVMREALRTVGVFRVKHGAGAEASDVARQAYYDRLIAEVRDHDFTNWED